MKSNTEVIVNTLERFSTKVEKGFVAIEEALDHDPVELKKEIDQIKKRLDDANIK